MVGLKDMESGLGSCINCTGVRASTVCDKSHKPICTLCVRIVIKNATQVEVRDRRRYIK